MRSINTYKGTKTMRKPLIIALYSLMSGGNLWAQIYDIRDYGATNDTTKVCTTAIQKAIDSCWKAGGGQVLVPTGLYKSGTIIMKPS